MFSVQILKYIQTRIRLTEVYMTAPNLIHLKSLRTLQDDKLDNRVLYGTKILIKSDSNQISSFSYFIREVCYHIVGSGHRDIACI